MVVNPNILYLQRFLVSLGLSGMKFCLAETSLKERSSTEERPLCTGPNMKFVAATLEVSLLPQRQVLGDVLKSALQATGPDLATSYISSYLGAPSVSMATRCSPCSPHKERNPSAGG